MIRAELWLDASGGLRALRANGHSGAGEPGARVACAATSSAIRAAYTALDGKRGFTVSVKAPWPGSLSFEVAKSVEADAAWLSGLTDMLIAALRGVAEDFPGELTLTMYAESRTRP